MKITYRRASDGDTWHFCRRCSTWPGMNFIELVAPDYGLKDVELCVECITRRSIDDCQLETV